MFIKNYINVKTVLFHAFEVILTNIFKTVN